MNNESMTVTEGVPGTYRYMKGRWENPSRWLKRRVERTPGESFKAGMKKWINRGSSTSEEVQFVREWLDNKASQKRSRRKGGGPKVEMAPKKGKG